MDDYIVNLKNNIKNFNWIVFIGIPKTYIFDLLISINKPTLIIIPDNIYKPELENQIPINLISNFSFVEGLIGENDEEYEYFFYNDIRFNGLKSKKSLKKDYPNLRIIKSEKRRKFRLNKILDKWEPSKNGKGNLIIINQQSKLYILSHYITLEKFGLFVEISFYSKNLYSDEEVNLYLQDQNFENFSSKKIYYVKENCFVNIWKFNKFLELKNNYQKNIDNLNRTIKTIFPYELYKKKRPDLGSFKNIELINHFNRFRDKEKINLSEYNYIDKLENLHKSQSQLINKIKGIQGYIKNAKDNLEANAKIATELLEKSNLIKISNDTESDLNFLNKNRPVCYNCFSSNTHKIDRNKHFDTDIFSCFDCGLIQSQFVVFDYVNNYYRRDYRTFRKDLRINDSYINYMKKRADSQFNYIKENVHNINGFSNTLDIGAGTGMLANKFQKIAKAHATEWDINMANWIRNNLNVEILDENYLIDKTNNEKFDIVTLSHVFEHINNPLEFLYKVSKIIKNDGYLFIEVPHENLEVMIHNSKNNKIDYAHLFHYSVDTLQQIITKSNIFQIIDTSTFSIDIEDWMKGVDKRNNTSKNQKGGGVHIRCILKKINSNQTSKNYDYLDSVLQGKYVENYINKKKHEKMEKNFKLISNNLKKLIESTNQLSETLKKIDLNSDT